MRFATRGAAEVEGNVEFVLSTPTGPDGLPLHHPPSVTGSIVEPLRGRTIVEPFQVEGVDLDGNLIEAFEAGGRWAALGRLVDVQWRTFTGAYGGGGWRTFGTGRCSQLDEAGGPGLFRIEVSDESWVSRRARIWTGADTTQLWPVGVRWSWRGLGIARVADGSQVGGEAEFVRLQLSASGVGSEVTSDLERWVENDAKPPRLRDQPGSGNFKHLRLRYPNGNDVMTDWEVMGFGSGPTFSMETLSGAVGEGPATLDVWVRWPGTPFASPAAEGEGFLYAPTAPPDGYVRLHLGVASDEHPWGNGPNPAGGPFNAGYLHIADLTRRVWEAMEVRYDAAALAELEGDLSFPVMAPIIERTPDDPEEWMAREIWGPNGLIALKDAEGRRKLVDLRPPPEDLGLEGLPVFNASTTRDHRWRLVGSEIMNSIVWEYRAFADEQVTLALVAPSLQLGPPWGEVQAEHDVDVQGPALDGLRSVVGRLGPFESDNVEFVGVRQRVLRQHQTLEPLDVLVPGNLHVSRTSEAITTLRGTLLQYIVGALSSMLLVTYQDGPVRYSGLLHGDVADATEEGRYIIVNESSTRGANPTTAAREGNVLALLLSLTRHPAHSEYEALRIRPATPFPVFAPCPEVG